MNTAFALRSGSAGKTSQRVLDEFTHHSRFSAPGRHTALLDKLPSDPAGIARVAQGLLIYEHVAEPFYGVRIPEARRAESHIRPLEKIIDAVLALDGRPLEAARPPEKRLV